MYGFALQGNHHPELLRNIVNLRHQWLQLLLEIFSIFCQHDIPALGRKQRNPQVILQPPDRLGQRRLRDMQVFCAVRHMLRAGRFQKIPDLHQFHTKPLSCLSFNS